MSRSTCRSSSSWRTSRGAASTRSWPCARAACPGRPCSSSWASRSMSCSRASTRIRDLPTAGPGDTGGTTREASDPASWPAAGAEMWPPTSRRGRGVPTAPETPGTTKARRSTGPTTTWGTETLVPGGGRMDRIRVATLQYFIRPVRTFQAFRDQVEGLVDTAADNHCHLLVFPEYFTTQLLTLGDVKRPISEQIHDLSQQVPRFVDLMSGLARRSRMYLVAGTIPAVDDGMEPVYNQCFLFGPSGEHGIQRKLHLTRFETQEWKVSPGERLRVFDTGIGRMAITICYDVEFPE